MTNEELKIKIQKSNNKLDIANIVDEIMATPLPWFFLNQFKNKAIDKFQQFRTYMANVFKIPATNIFICGSALLGFSLSPDKNYNSFNENSDIDIVIIDSKMFNSYWKVFFNDYVYAELTGNNYTMTAKNIFKHFIDFHYNYAANSSLYVEWEKRTSGYIKDLQIKFNFPEQISYRIYSSFEDYRQNLSKLSKSKVKKYRKDFQCKETNRYFFIILARSSFCEIFFVAEKKVVVRPFLPALLRGLGMSFVLVLKLRSFFVIAVANILISQRLP